MPFVHEVFYSEYVQKTREGIVNKFWQKAQTMTKKVAMAQGFRLCFSDELGGMPYTKEEVSDIEDITRVEVSEVKETPVPEFFKTPEEKEQDAYNLILMSQTPENLKENWLAIGRQMQAVPRILDLKNRLKVELDKLPV